MSPGLMGLFGLPYLFCILSTRTHCYTLLTFVLYTYTLDSRYLHSPCLVFCCLEIRKDTHDFSISTPLHCIAISQYYHRRERELGLHSTAKQNTCLFVYLSISTRRRTTNIHIQANPPSTTAETAAKNNDETPHHFPPVHSPPRRSTHSSARPTHSIHTVHLGQRFQRRGAECDEYV